MLLGVLKLTKIHATIMIYLDAKAYSFVVRELAVENITIRILDSSEARARTLPKRSLVRRIMQTHFSESVMRNWLLFFREFFRPSFVKANFLASLDDLNMNTFIFWVLHVFGGERRHNSDFGGIFLLGALISLFDACLIWFCIHLNRLIQKCTWLKC